MKKGIVLILIAGLMASMLASCGAGKCDICGGKATEEYEGVAYCDDCIDDIKDLFF